MGFPPSAEPLSDVSRVLCVFAHPDDVDFGAAGTVAGWVGAGIEVSYLLVTRGDAGGFDDTPRELMPAIREAEQRAAAAVLGVNDVSSWTGTATAPSSRRSSCASDITRAIRRVRPDRVLTSSPLRRWERLAGPRHPDHLAVGEATTCAIYPDARNEFAFPDLMAEGLKPWVVREVWYQRGRRRTTRSTSPTSSPPRSRRCGRTPRRSATRRRALVRQRLAQAAGPPACPRAAWPRRSRPAHRVARASGQTRRRSAAQRDSSYRLDIWSLRSTFDTCVSTVLIEM